MSKYEPLWKAIGGRTEDSFTLTYAEIEQILGFPIDHAFLTFKKELPSYGYEVGKISMTDRGVQTLHLTSNCVSDIIGFTHP